MYLIRSAVAFYTFYKMACWLFLLVLALATGCINDQELEFNPVLDMPPTCSDGLKNQDETAVDCGGACSKTCGDDILAPCSAELKPNVVLSASDNVFYISRVFYSRSYGYPNLLEITAIDEESDDEVSIKLPLAEFPAGNMKFTVDKEVSYNEENPRASIVLEPYYGTRSQAVTGTLYLRIDDKTVHLEFCNILFQPFYSSNITFHSYTGNINFHPSDSEY